ERLRRPEATALRKRRKPSLLRPRMPTHWPAVPRSTTKRPEPAQAGTVWAHTGQTDTRQAGSAHAGSQPTGEIASFLPARPRERCPRVPATERSTCAASEVESLLTSGAPESEPSRRA